MEFSVSKAQREQAERFRVFAETRLSPGAAKRDKEPEIDEAAWRGIWTDLAAEGLLGLSVPEQFGGDGNDTVSAAIALLGFGDGCADNGVSLALGAHLWPFMRPILEFGTEEQKADLVPALVAGDVIVAHAITEAAAGSNALALSATATRDGDGYVLNGTKSHIGGAPFCDLAMVFASTAPDRGRWGVSVFLVPTDLPGVTRGAPEAKTGLCSAPYGELAFSDVRIPAGSRLGPEGAGASIFNRSLEWERRLIFAPQVGGMLRLIRMATDHSRDRNPGGGGPIIGHQSVSNRLADMRLRYETARLMLLRAAWELDQGRSDVGFASLTKLHLSESFKSTAEDAFRIFGAEGYRQDSETARSLRDALGGVIYGGTSDIQRLVAAHTPVPSGSISDFYQSSKPAVVPGKSTEDLRDGKGSKPN